ncbi:MAG: glycosyl transferase, partial [Curvibacter sp.]
GLHAQQLAREHGIPRLAVQHRSLGSRLAWYAQPLPVYVLTPEVDQFEQWHGPLRRYYSAILLDWSQQSYQLPVGEGLFERCELDD